MPRVVPNQKEKFESDDTMKKNSRESEVRYTGFRDRPLHERQAKFHCSLREGYSLHQRQCDFEKEPGRVHIRSPFILNGVCVRWRGYLDLERLDGVGCIEFDEDTAKVEDAILREQVEAYNRRLREFEEHAKERQRQLAVFMGQRQQHQQALSAAAAAAAAVAASHGSSKSHSSNNSNNNNNNSSSQDSPEKSSTSSESISPSHSLNNSLSSVSELIEPRKSSFESSNFDLSSSLVSSTVTGSFFVEEFFWKDDGEEGKKTYEYGSNSTGDDNSCDVDVINILEAI
ncbi:Protein big brother,Protein brother,Core-binding factor subunit beta [Lepeophtheirus salmonis]|uniref:Protein big brother,Protein brother,Core-binding factor subunit beta n=1 Tax=Lepeophtheirus salmonis TaxID=72036 RepID=A0A7R8H649_LEPSM|nr:Protein big brother,Protein brother,Core-binding factor subunit beta [Lepeophtheirus salmonis]CAF2895145.1 Protein big brother,Protein brother,Core-binding factor subunit beta [Lepeophtheirus salmonis]